MKYLIKTLFFALFFLTGCGLFSNPDKRLLTTPFGNDPHPLEKLYYNLAGTQASEKACYLISPDSYTVAPLNVSGKVVQLTRSDCFRNVAIRSLNTTLCDRVETASTWIYSGTGLDREHCIREADGQQRVTGNLYYSSDIVEKASLSDEEIKTAMTDLGIFPDAETVNAYQTERKEQFTRCSERYVIYSELFFRKMDNFRNFAGAGDLELMREVEWKEHPYIRQPGFTDCFLADGANHWIERGVSARQGR